VPFGDPTTAEGHSIPKGHGADAGAVSPMTDLPSVRCTQALCPITSRKQAVGRPSSRSRPGT
jgi:hypothetical protein